MLKEIESPGEQITASDVDEVESAIGMRLPPDYMVFLLTYNGGRPVPDLFPIRGMANNPIGRVHTLFGVTRDIEADNVAWNYEVFLGRLPSNLLAIGDTGSGDIICLSMFGNDAGSVLLWDRYDEHEDPTYDNVYFVAPSFNAFLNSLH